VPSRCATAEVCPGKPALLCPDDSFALPLMALPGSHECNEANDAIIDGIIIPRSRGEEELEENRIEAR